MHIFPNIMYFGSSKELNELKHRVFLTPHIGIASLFIVDRSDLPIQCREYSFNIGYRQWNYPNEKLQRPLHRINMIHNIKDLSDQVFTGQSKGFIYTIDTANIKQKLSLYATNDPDREVIYTGEKSLKIIDRIPHALSWDFAFEMEQIKKHGLATRYSL